MNPPLRRPVPGPAAALALLGAALAVASLPATRAAEPLAPALARHLAQPAFAHASWGLEVADARSGTVLFATNAHCLLKPASNAKLFTGALALDLLGPDHRLRTDLVPTGPLSRRGTLRGNLVLFGRGDFSFAARFHDGDHSRSLTPIVDALRRAGVRRIDGDLVADDSFFQGPPFGTGWTWDDLQYYYGAEVGALGVDDNVIDLAFHPGPAAGDPVRLVCRPEATNLRFLTSGLRTGPPGSRREVEVRRAPGSRDVVCTGTLPAGGGPWEDAVSVPEPALHFATLLRARLDEAGIPVRGGVRHEPGAAARARQDRDPAARPTQLPPPVLAVESPPMSELVARMMKPSQNLYAQLLLLEAGTHAAPPAATAPDTASETSEQRGLGALAAFLDRAGIPRDEVRLDDGSGLSRSSLVTADAVVRLLRHMDRSPHREAFLAALPVAGRDGTLRNRLRETRAANNLVAKTGSLRYVSSLSGFVTNAAGQRLVFSALLNAYAPDDDGPSGREALDTLVGLLTDCPVTDTP